MAELAEIRLVIADVDGTLLTDDKVLTPRARAAVCSVRAAGIHFTITSGRPPRGMKMLIDALQLTDPIAAFNGGVLVHPDLSTIHQYFLPGETARQAAKIMVTHSLDVWLYTDREWLVRDPHGPHVAREEWTVKFSPVVVQNLEPYLDCTAKLVGVSDDYEAVARCEHDVRQQCGDRVSAARSQPYYLDVTHPEANKGTVVQMLSQALHISPEHCATIGDMPNDVLMFQRAGLSIAMGQASDEVKQAARFVTASNAQEGFAIAMERFVLGSRRGAGSAMDNREARDQEV